MKKPYPTVLWLLLASAFGATAQDNWADRSPHKTEFITVNGVRLHYLDWGGKGETMLFLHGLGDTPHIFDDIAPKFTNQFHVLGLTRRGHGQSEKPETGYDTATLVEDIRQFLDALKIGRVVLVGHSIAGDELSRFAVVHPDRVIKLVYLDAAYDRTRMPEMNKKYPPELSATKTDIESLDNMRRWSKRMNNSWSEAWEATLREQFSSDDPAEKSRTFQLVIQGTFDSHADYAKIQAPALSFFVVGYNKIIDFAKALPDPAGKNVEEYLSRATQFTHQEIEHFRNEIPNGKIIVFTNTDHHCFIQREDEVVREMREFLAQTESRAPQVSLPVITLPVAVELEIPVAPTPVKANGKMYLVYELHITNFRTNNLELTRVEVLGDGANRPPIASYSDQELAIRLAHPGFFDKEIARRLGVSISPDQPEDRVIGRGMRAVMYLLITVDREADIPPALRHRLFFKGDSQDRNAEDVVEGARVMVNQNTPLVLGAPLRGEGWLAANGLSNTSHHRRGLVVLGGKARIPQRFAIDWTRIGVNGQPAHDEAANNANWYGYGSEVLAVADAVVVDVKDGIPENDPTSDKRAIALTIDTVAGNCVMLGLGKGYFAFYAHLIPKSIRVHIGDKVRRGQVLALLGNSGNSGGPHLHFQITDGSLSLASEGVPYVFDSFEQQDILPPLGRVWKEWKPPANVDVDKRGMEIPVDNAVISFP